MSNNYFQFKQFRIEQQYSAMKVCTDSCIFGASVSVENAVDILDIGTGTGLLALMLAQRMSPISKIDAVEINQEAYTEACQNIALSPWSSQIKLFHQDINDFNREQKKMYDLIISNPPFYDSHPKSPTPSKNTALHNDCLELEELLYIVVSQLKESGNFWVLLPEYQADKLKQTALKMGLFVVKEIVVYQKLNGKVLRKMIMYAKKNTHPILSEQLIIKDGKDEYSADFIRLLSPYYLIF